MAQRDPEREHRPSSAPFAAAPGSSAASNASTSPESRGHVTITSPDSVLVETDDPWPLIDAERLDDRFVVQADLPGMSAREIQVELEDDLIISGERQRVRREGGHTYYQERSFGPFRRRVHLTEGVRPETAQAWVDSGVLTIEFETRGKREAAAPRRVEVRQGRPS